MPTPSLLDSMFEDETLDLRASVFAIQKHGDQMYGERPYYVHLVDVVAVLRAYGVKEEAWLVAAAWLHDVVEDTPTTVEDIEKLFGSRVANIVHAVTCPPGNSRTERYRSVYKKLALSPHGLIVKLADRISNANASKEHRPDLFQMYKDEYPEFRKFLYKETNDLVALRMWNRLDMLFGVAS